MCPCICRVCKYQSVLLVIARSERDKEHGSTKNAYSFQNPTP